MPSIMAAGGAAPATMLLTWWVMPCLSASGAAIMADNTMGAPQWWVTLWARMASKMAFGSTRRRQTLTPARAATVQGKHQPLQWNMGSVHRYTACLGMSHSSTLLMAL